jgi:hypothetical protein
VAVSRELLGNTVPVPVQFGTSENVPGVIELFDVPYRLITIFAAGQVMSPLRPTFVPELHRVNPYGT